MSQVPLIEIHDATIWRGTTCVFKNLSLTIQQHERIAILGPNGCGKTTLLKVINREIYPVFSPDSWVRILGKQRWNVWDLRKHIGLVSQDLQSGFPYDSTVFESILSGFFSTTGVNTQMGEGASARQKEKTEEIMRKVGMHELREREYHTLSTGQRRRCLLGRALVHSPPTLILDEPTSGLDLTAGFNFLSTIRELARQGCNLLFVTHHLTEIPPEIDRVIMLKEGQLVADGTKKEVLTGALLSDVYETPIRVAQVDGHYLAYPGE